MSSSFSVGAATGTAEAGIVVEVLKSPTHVAGQALAGTEVAAEEMLDADRVGKEAEKAVLALSLTREEAFESYYRYVIVDEPAVHLMPLHFVPHASRGRIGEGFLRKLAVVAKLEYARNRWLDQVADRPDFAPSLLSTHRVNDALLALIRSLYDEVFRGDGGDFFAVLSSLYARHGLSLTLDSTWHRNPTSSITLDQYTEHARRRHGPIRAAVDALLLSVGATDDLLERARSSWHACALGIQFYDDALDVEEDFRDRNLSWAVSRTLERFGGQAAPDPDTFYELAQTEGVVSETLDHAEKFFAESARLAGETFPSWAAYQQACISRVRRLRGDYEKLLAGA